MIFLSEKFPINPTQKVKIEGEFKGLNDKDTNFYFGIACYNMDKIISSHDVMRISSTAKVLHLIKDGTSAYKRLLVTCEETEDKTLNWNINNNVTRGYDYEYNLGIYFDGNINKHRSGNHSKVINYRGIRETDNHSILLNIEIPEDVRNKIIEGTTKVIRHTASTTYLYSAANNCKLTSNWIKKSGEISGMANLGSRDDYKFWLDTNSFKVFILANYNKSTE